MSENSTTLFTLDGAVLYSTSGSTPSGVFGNGLTIKYDKSFTTLDDNQLITQEIFFDNLFYPVTKYCSITDDIKQYILDELQIGDEPLSLSRCIPSFTNYGESIINWGTGLPIAIGDNSGNDVECKTIQPLMPTFSNIIFPSQKYKIYEPQDLKITVYYVGLTPFDSAAFQPSPEADPKICDVTLKTNGMFSGGQGVNIKGTYLSYGQEIIGDGFLYDYGELDHDAVCAIKIYVRLRNSDFKLLDNYYSSDYGDVKILQYINNLDYDYYYYYNQEGSIQPSFLKYVGLGYNTSLYIPVTKTWGGKNFVYFQIPFNFVSGNWAIVDDYPLVDWDLGKGWDDEYYSIKSVKEIHFTWQLTYDFFAYYIVILSEGDYSGYPYSNIAIPIGINGDKYYIKIYNDLQYQQIKEGEFNYATITLTNNLNCELQIVDDYIS